MTYQQHNPDAPLGHGERDALSLKLDLSTVIHILITVATVIAMWSTQAAQVRQLTADVEILKQSTTRRDQEVQNSINTLTTQVGVTSSQLVELRSQVHDLWSDRFVDIRGKQH